MWFVALIMGHLCGDYLFQGKYLALNKTKDWKVCLLHTVIYVACVCLWLLYFGYTITPLIVLLLFLSHFPLDYFTFYHSKHAEYKESIPALWLRAIGGRNMIDEQNDDFSTYKEIRVSFACLVYTVVDNTIHLMLMVFFLKSLLE